MRAEAESRRLAEEEVRKRAEAEARRRAQEEAERLAAEQARRAAEEQARRRVEEEERQRAEAEARRHAEAEARRRSEENARLRAEEEARLQAETEVQQRAELEARIRAEVDAKLRAEESEQQRVREQFEEDNSRTNGVASAEWFRATEESEFEPVSVPEQPVSTRPSGGGRNVRDRAAALRDLPSAGTEESFQQITEAFDDAAPEVRNAAAQALYEFQEDRAAAFTRALRDAPAERRARIGAAIASSGLAEQAINNLTGESREKTYDAFSLLFLMSKSGQINPLMRAIEGHPNTEVRLAVVKLLALSGQPDVLPSFRRMAVRGSLPPDVRSAVMEAIYQITSQSPTDATPTA
jgi:hypothetical protein